MSEITQEQFQALRQEVDEAKSEADRAQGALDQLNVRLRDEFGCRTLKEAKTKLSELQDQQAAAEKEFDTALKEYEKKWHHD